MACCNLFYFFFFTNLIIVIGGIPGSVPLLKPGNIIKINAIQFKTSLQRTRERKAYEIIPKYKTVGMKPQ